MASFPPRRRERHPRKPGSLLWITSKPLATDPLAVSQPPASARTAPRFPPSFSRPRGAVQGRAAVESSLCLPMPLPRPPLLFCSAFPALLPPPAAKFSVASRALWRRLGMDGQEDASSPHLSSPCYTSPSRITSGCEIGGKYFFSEPSPSHTQLQCYFRPGTFLLPCLTCSRIQPKSWRCLPGACTPLLRSRASRDRLDLPGSRELPAPKRTSPWAWGRAGSIPGMSRAHLCLGCGPVCGGTKEWEESPGTVGPPLPSAFMEQGCNRSKSRWCKK